MENVLGLLRLRIKRGISLAVRDTRSSDPYVVVTMAEQESCAATEIVKESCAATASIMEKFQQMHSNE